MRKNVPDKGPRPYTGVLNVCSHDSEAAGSRTVGKFEVVRSQIGHGVHPRRAALEGPLSKERHSKLDPKIEH
jgi:hypothetical protein